MCLMTGALVLLYSLFPSRPTTCDNFSSEPRNLLFEEKGIRGPTHFFHLTFMMGLFISNENCFCSDGGEEGL